MNVTIRKETRSFAELEIGGVFVHVTEAYMKIKEVLDPNSDESYNAVNLNEGDLISLRNDLLVEPCKADLMVWR